MSDAAVRAARATLLAHPLYSLVNDLPRLRIFMQNHVFAVWDFMSLLKRLQRDFGCITVPWMPPEEPELARFVNEIVLAEESDRDPAGSAASHLQIYLSAMQEVGSDRTLFLSFLSRLREGHTPLRALAAVRAPLYVRKFVLRTIKVATKSETIEVLADFLYGREDLIPEMFGRLLTIWGNPETEVPAFKFYLERHVELDAGDHGPSARRALGRLTSGNDALQGMAERAAHAALVSRKRLWDGIASSFVADIDGRGRDRRAVLVK